MRVRALFAMIVTVAVIGAVLPAGVSAEPPQGSPPIGGLATGLYIDAGGAGFTGWYDTLYGQRMFTTPDGGWLRPIGQGQSGTPYWAAIDVSSTDPNESIHGDLWQAIGGGNYFMNGVVATLWADRNADGVFGPAAADGAWLDQDVTHCVIPPYACGDYVLEGTDGSYPRGITLEIGTPGTGVTSYKGYLWYLE